MIDLTPLEVRKKKGDFRRALRGYEPVLVDDFLDLVADRIEHLVRESAGQAERLADLERRVSEYRLRERALTDALVTAQEMRDEIRAQTAREAELARRSSTQEAEARLQDAEQRAEGMVREAEQRARSLQEEAEQRSQALLRDAEYRSQAMVREAEQRAQSLVREAEQRAGQTVRAAEEDSEGRLRQARQEADAELQQAREEAASMRADTTLVREREEEALRRLRIHQQQQVATYRGFLERELAELDGLLAALAEGEPAAPVAGAAAEVEEGPAPGEPRDSRAAAAAAVLAQSFLSEETETYGEDTLPGGPLEFVPFEEEPFEPEPVYEEDLEPRRPQAEALEAAEVAGGAGEGRPEDEETDALLENAALAGYRLDLADELPAEAELLPEEPELLLEEPAGDSPDDDEDWLSSIIEDRK